MKSNVKEQIIDVWQKEKHGDFHDKRDEQKEIAQNLSIAIETVILDWYSGRGASVYCVLKLLEDLPFCQIEETICWMLHSDELKWLGAACYRVLKEKSDAMYFSCLQAAIREENPSFNRDLIWPCRHHKGVLHFYQDLHDIIINDLESDENRAGALNSIYWSGVESWPSVSAYDEYIEAPDRVIDQHVEIVYNAVTSFSKSQAERSAYNKEQIRSSAIETYSRYKNFDRKDLEKMDHLRTDIANCCLGIFLDINKALNLRKMAYHYFPREGPGTNILSEVNIRKLPLVLKAAQTFPDGFMQSSIAYKPKKGEIPLLHSITEPLSLRHKVSIFINRCIQTLTTAFCGRGHRH